MKAVAISLLTAFAGLLILGCSEAQSPEPEDAGSSTTQSGEPKGTPSEDPSSSLETPDPKTFLRLEDYVFTKRFHPYREGEVIKGILFGDHKATIGGVLYTFLDNTEIEFYREGEGKVRLARLKHNKTVRVGGTNYNLRGGYQHKRGKSDIEFYPNGSVRRAGLSSSTRVVLGGKQYQVQAGYDHDREGTDISFYGDGKVRSAFLVEDLPVSMNGIDYRFRSNAEAIFHPNGAVSEALVLFELDLSGERYPINELRVSFGEDGTVLSGIDIYPSGGLLQVRLARDREIVVGGINYRFGEGPMDFHENGGIKAAFLMRDTTARIGGTNVVLHGGSRIVLHENGAFKAGNTSIDVSMGNVDYRFRAGWVVFSDEGELLSSSRLERHDNGTIKEAFLMEPKSVLLGEVLYGLKPGEIRFHSNGKVAMATLAEQLLLQMDGKNFVLIEGGLLTFHPNGQLSDAYISRVSFGGNSYPVNPKTRVWFTEGGLLRNGFYMHGFGQIASFAISEPTSIRMNGGSFVLAGRSTVSFYPSGELKSAVVVGTTVRLQLSGREVMGQHVILAGSPHSSHFLLQSRSEITFHENGFVDAAQLHPENPHITTIGGNQFVFSDAITFYPTGAVKRAFFNNGPIAVWVGGRQIFANGAIRFYASGNVNWLTTSQIFPPTIPDGDNIRRTFSSGRPLHFHENGHLKEGFLSDGTRARFDTNGRLVE